MLKFFSKHKFAAVILVAVLVGVIYGGTPLMVWKNFRSNGELFVLSQFKTYRDSLYTYLPRAREIYDGYFPPGELSVGKQLPTIQNSLPTLMFSAFVYLWRGNINAAYLTAQFFFSGVIFILLYLLGWTLWRSRPWAFFLGLVGVLSPIATKLPFLKWRGLSEFTAFFINNFIPFVRTQFDQLYLARIDEPLLTYPIYFLAVLAFLIFWQKPSRWHAIFAGAATGLIFYVYFHHWVYWVVVVGLLFLHALIFKWKDGEYLKNYLALFAALIVVVTPYFVNYFQFNSLPIAQDFIYREGVAYGRSLGILSVNLADYGAYLALAVIAYLLYWKNDRRKVTLFFAMILAMMIVWNVQLVVGYSPVPHFFRRAISPVIFIILFDFLREAARRWEIVRPYARKIVLASILVLSIFVVTKKLVNMVGIANKIQPHLVDYYKFPSDLVSSWGWINSHLEPEPKIISPSTMTSLYLMTHTSARPFLPTAFASLLSMRDIEDRYLVAHKLFGISEKTLRQRLEGKMPLDCEGYQCFPDKGSNLNDSFWHIYGNYFASRYASFKTFIMGGEPLVVQKRAEKIDELVGRYRETAVSWGNVDADYVYVGPWEKHLGITDLSRNPKLKLIYQNPLAEIYQIQR